MATKTEAPKEDPKASSSHSQKTSRVDWRKQKELEEARKAGTAPPEVDEEGRDINPHIPQYITSVPWYIGLDRPTLKHQRPQDEKHQKYHGLDDWYKRGAPTVPSATKFRKGACENCGAMTHKKKECLERPRKVGAKYSGDDIRPDEFIQPELSFDYAGKRDRWAGYNIDNHVKIVEEYSKIDEAKRHLKAEKLDVDMAEGLTEAVAAKLVGDDDEDDKYADAVDMPGQKFDSNVRTTVRNLRIREDTAKYLYNLDPNSSYYDPKTRSMRENPFREGIKGKTVNYYGDNWVRSSGDVRHMAGAQMFAWEAYERGADVHLQADPTKLELLHREYAVKKDTFEKGQKESILEKYGGEEHLDAPSKDLLLAQTEEYVEYSRTGKVIKGQEKAIAKSKYEEDVYINNHTSVWGSYWEEFKWGYSCCHSFVKMAYCTGEAGKRARVSETPLQEAIADAPPDENKQKSMLELHKEKMEDNKKKINTSNDKSNGKDDDDDEKERLNRVKMALKAEEKRTKEIDQLLKIDERKRPYNSLNKEYREPTEDEMDAYRIKRRRDEDPMAQFSK